MSTLIVGHKMSNPGPSVQAHKREDADELPDNAQLDVRHRVTS
jgi:hypothetical protein